MLRFCRAFVFPLLAFLAVALSCTEIAVTAVDVYTVEITPRTGQVRVEERLQLSVRVVDAAGRVLRREVTWSTSAPAVAAVTSTGEVLGLAVGSVRITATSGGVTGEATLVVMAKRVATVAVSPATNTVLAGDSVRFQATARAADGSVVTGHPVAWSVADPPVAQVRGDGWAIGVAVGSTTVAAVVDGVRGEATLSVRARVVIARIDVAPALASVDSGQSVQFTATARAGDGTVITPPPPVTWSSGNPAVAIVDATGRATGVAPGSATILASAAGQTGSTNLTVNPSGPRVASVQIVPQADTLMVGSGAWFRAIPRASDGTVLSRWAIRWTVADPGVLSVNPATGDSTFVRGVGVGASMIAATAGGVSGQGSVRVDGLPVASVSIQPSSDTIPEGGGSVTLIATVKTTDGAVAKDRLVRWSSNNTAIVSVVETGPFRQTAVIVARNCPPVSVCSVTITATAEAVSSSATIFVRKIAASIAVVPANPSIHERRTTTFTAEVRASDGTLLPDRAVDWTWTPAGRLTVAPTGSYSQTADVTTGTCAVGSPSCPATLTADAGGLTASSAITILKPIATVAITPTPPALFEGDSVALTVTATAADGTVIPDRAAAWSTSAASVATVTPSGPFSRNARVRAVACPTGSSTCTVTISVTIDGVSDAEVVTVRKRVAAVNVVPASVTLLGGTSTNLQAEPRASDGTLLTDRTTTWASNQAYATVAASGPFGQTGVVNAVDCPVNVESCAVTISATADGITGAAAVTVLKPIATITVAPPADTLLEAATTVLTATATAADGTNITRPPTWVSADPAIATVAPSGMTATVTAVTCPVGQSACNTTVTASAEGKSASATIRVVKRVASVSVSLSVNPVFEGGSSVATADVRAADGTALPGRTVTWSTSNAAVASVTPTGAQTADVTAGTCPMGSESCSASITATVEGVSGSATQTVLKPIATIVVAPPAATLFEGASVVLTATATAADGTPITRPLTWASANPAIASVAPSGNTATVTAGTCPMGQPSCSTTVTASAEGKSGSSTITVMKPVAAVAVSLSANPIFEGGGSIATASVTAADGTVLPGRIVTWSSSNAAVATVTPTGAQTASVTAGTCLTGSESCSASITATVEGVSGSATQTVLKPIATIVVTPPAATLFEAASTVLTATATAADGTPITRPLTWASANPAIASVSPSGNTATVTAGTCPTGQPSCSTTVTASAEGKSGSSTITVLKSAATVTVFLAPDSMYEGAASAATADVRAADGTALPGRTVTWSSSDNAIASVTATGAQTADVTAGVCPMGMEDCTASITATVEGVSGSATQKVLKPVATVTVTPATATLSISTSPSATFTATLEAADGTVITKRVSLISWSTADPGVVTFTPATGPSTTATADPTAAGKTTRLIATIVDNGATITGSATVDVVS